MKKNYCIDDHIGQSNSFSQHRKDIWPIDYFNLRTALKVLHNVENCDNAKVT